MESQFYVKTKFYIDEVVKNLFDFLHLKLSFKSHRLGRLIVGTSPIKVELDNEMEKRKLLGAKRNMNIKASIRI